MDRNESKQRTSFSRPILWLGLLFFPIAIWAALVIRYLLPLPELLLFPLILVWLSGSYFILIKGRTWPAKLSVGMTGIVFAVLIWSLQTPLDQRPDWAVDVARTLQYERDGNVLHLSNLRDTAYQSTTDYTVNWTTLTLDLRDLYSLDLIVEEISLGGLVSHVLLSFGWTDGTRISASVEIRRQQGETFSPIRGCFRNYELVYVLAHERDVLGLRLNHRSNPVRLYPVDTQPEAIRQLFLDILRRAAALSGQPEFYHTLTNNCTSNLVAHVDLLLGKPLAGRWESRFPESAARRVFEKGYIRTQEDDWEALRKAALLSPVPTESLTPQSWSAAIRGSVEVKNSNDD